MRGGRRVRSARIEPALFALVCLRAQLGQRHQPGRFAGWMGLGVVGVSQGRIFLVSPFDQGFVIIAFLLADFLAPLVLLADFVEAAIRDRRTVLRRQRQADRTKHGRCQQDGSKRFHGLNPSCKGRWDGGRSGLFGFRRLIKPRLAPEVPPPAANYFGTEVC